ncbi:Vacuolar protein sorting-associated protein 70 [Paramarasmius palmivorus]|uniref:Vacuolar protein sorting-associated protein 70 n=1 Tax=Paramarasmius palmivorus TaxID=297713 RepID=A0AAW0DPH5_9AGAR
MGKAEHLGTLTDLPGQVEKTMVAFETSAIVAGLTFWTLGRRAWLENEHLFTYSNPWEKEIEYEKLFLSIPDGESARAAATAYADHAHVAGSPQDFEDAKTMLKLFQDELGIRPPWNEPIFPAGTPKSRSATISLTEIFRPRSPTAWIDVYYPAMDKPLERSLDLLDEEGSPVLEFNLNEMGTPWHGYSADGEAEGSLIYVNYGRKEDYDELVEAGANFTGKIAIARYGQVVRGLKIQRAEELGAIGVLIYSDPRDDGYVTVENGYATYPHGPARNPTAIERGSVMLIPTYPSDPTTPGYPAYENAQRQKPTNIVKIPSLPISWQNAQRLLEEIGNVYMEVDGRKVLSGKSSESKVRLVNRVKYEITPIWNTMAAIPGHIPGEVVILGCHRDAWVAGAADPVSGTASLHEIVRAYGTLLRQGWKPLRTIIIASWDGEEAGILGSTEYGEDFASWISEHAVAYVNVDVSSAGSRWAASGSPSLAHLIKRTALDVPHPSIKGKSLWDATEDDGPFHDPDDSVDEEFIANYQKAEKRRRDSSLGIGPLGSGSDFVVFLERLGVASTDQSFLPTPHDSVYHYHSIYDTVRWQEEYADPGYDHHVAVARHLGLMVMRLADSVIVPLNTSHYALELHDYLDHIEDLASDMDDAELPEYLHTLRTSIAYLQVASNELDIEKREAEEKFKEALEKLPTRSRMASLFAGILDWAVSVGRFARGLLSGTEIEEGRPRFPWPKNPYLEFAKAARRVKHVNEKLIAFERGFLSEDGLKGREWYRHLGVAPGKWLGYDATTFPGISDAIQYDKNVTRAKEEVTRVVHLLDDLIEKIWPRRNMA